MNIKSIRLDLDLSQAKFADKFGIPLSTLAQWEQGRRKPPEYVLKMIYTIIKMERMLQQYFPNYDCMACDPEGSAPWSAHRAAFILVYLTRTSRPSTIRRG